MKPKHMTGLQAESLLRYGHSGSYSEKNVSLAAKR